MPDYTKGKIYKIWSHCGDKIYIGATTKNYLSERMSSHRSTYRQWKKNNARDRISSFDLFEEYGIENCKIELLEAKSCNGKDELKKLEGKYIRVMICVNRIIPDGTVEEKYEEAKVRHKKYYEKNKEKISENQKKYREQCGYVMPFQKETWSRDKVICSCGSEHRRDKRKMHITTKKHIKYIEEHVNIFTQ